MKHSYIAKRFQSSAAGLSLDTEALAKYKDIIDLSIGDTDFTTDEAIINAAFRDAKAGHTHYGDPKGDRADRRGLPARGRRTSASVSRATMCS